MVRGNDCIYLSIKSQIQQRPGVSLRHLRVKIVTHPTTRFSLLAGVGLAAFRRELVGITFKSREKAAEYFPQHLAETVKKEGCCS
jgi:hypothetical protein